jgi:polyisoprenoid-binding protein YceI
MKNILLTSMLILSLSMGAFAQKYITKTGYIRFYSAGEIEKIEAINRQVNAAFDQSTGDLVFKVLMKSFVFEKALMQDHFNENYVESDKYPNATFAGKVVNMKDISFGKDGVYNITVQGKLTIKGVAKDVKQTGTFEVKDGKILGKAKFNILLSDYSISIPSAVSRNISNNVEITVDIVLDKVNN